MCLSLTSKDLITRLPDIHFTYHLIFDLSLFFFLSLSLLVLYASSQRVAACNTSCCLIEHVIEGYMYVLGEGLAPVIRVLLMSSRRDRGGVSFGRS